MKKKVCCTLMALLMLIGIVSVFPQTSMAQSNNEECKISSRLEKELLTKSDNDLVDVYIYLSYEEVDETVMGQMKEEYPYEYKTYMLAKEGNESLSDLSDFIVDKDTDAIEVLSEESSDYQQTIQKAIEIKRNFYVQYYKKNNESFLRKHEKEVSVVFMSSYAPLCIATIPKMKIQECAKDDKVLFMDLFKDEESSISSLETANLTTRAAYVRDTYGNTGSGVKIGQIEPGIPYTTNSDLTSASITTNSSFGPNTTAAVRNHATRVARIMVGSSAGIAPDATLFCVGCTQLSSHYEAIEWLLSKGVNVINMSANFYNSFGYDNFCAYIDHLAVQHDVHFVVSAGNVGNGGDNTTHIVSPGMAYNAITVGNFSDNGTGPANDSEINLYQADDYLVSSSKYSEHDTSNRPEKPNLVAPGYNILEDSGTSFSAPQVTAVIAQLCSYRSALKTRQSSMGAILAASCGRKLRSEVESGTEIVTSSGFKGGKFTASASVTGSGNQISKKQGAGKLDSRWARSIVSSGNYWPLTLSGSTSEYTKTVHITASTNALTRVAIFWLKRNTVDSQNNVIQISLPNWNLYVYDPNGTLVGSSITSYSNYEIVQFVPSISGTYTIKLLRAGSYTEKSHIAIAVW